jgi:hypothetical protein
MKKISFYILCVLCVLHHFVVVPPDLSSPLFCGFSFGLTFVSFLDLIEGSQSLFHAPGSHFLLPICRSKFVVVRVWP